MILHTGGGCGSHLKTYGHLLHDDPFYAAKAKVWDSKVKDIHEWLAKIGITEPKAQGQPKQTVTYHESCHLCHGQKISSQPRQVLRKIPGLQLVLLAGRDEEDAPPLAGQVLPCPGRVRRAWHAAFRGELDALDLHPGDRVGQAEGAGLGNVGVTLEQRLGPGAVAFDEVKGHARRRFRADAGQAAQRLDQLRELARIGAHAPRTAAAGLRTAVSCRAAAAGRR